MEKKAEEFLQKIDPDYDESFSFMDNSHKAWRGGIKAGFKAGYEAATKESESTRASLAEAVAALESLTVACEQEADFREEPPHQLVKDAKETLAAIRARGDDTTGYK